MFDEKFWIAISLLIFVALIYKKLSLLIAENFHKKSSDIADELMKASNLKDAANELKDLHFKQKKENLEKAKQIIRNAKAAAEKLSSEYEIELKSVINAKKIQAEKHIEDIEKEAVFYLRSASVTRAVEKFSNFVADGKSDQKIYEIAVANLTKSLNSSHKIKNSSLL